MKNVRGMYIQIWRNYQIKKTVKDLFLIFTVSALFDKSKCEAKYFGFDEYVDIKSLYVINLVDSPSKFMDEYQKTKSKDYKDYADDVKEQFADFVDS